MSGGRMKSSKHVMHLRRNSGGGPKWLGVQCSCGWSEGSPGARQDSLRAAHRRHLKEVSTVRWVKGARGYADRVSVCGRYTIEMIELGCRHEPGPYWSARLTEKVGGETIWLTSEGQRMGFSRYRDRGPGGGPLQEAKASAQAHLHLSLGLTNED